MALASGSRLGPYTVGTSLGAGGMGEVYRARDTRLGREVAIKVLPADVAGDAERRARFEREARAVAALSHPNILALHDLGTEGETLYVVTELLDGETLAERLRSGALPVRKAIEIAIAIARGLGAAHEKGIAHRDLKPANVFLLADGQVKLLDFGLARETTATPGDTTTQSALTDPGTVLGTAGYMAPEQVRGQAVDGRADLFALGVVLYEMLTGQRAFARESTVETLNAILKEDPPELTTARAGLPPALDRLVRHCLEKSPAERFQTARDVVFALEGLSGTGTAVAASGSAPATGPGAWRRNPRLAWGVAGVAVAATVAAGLALAALVAATRTATGDGSGTARLPMRFQVPWPTRADVTDASSVKFLEIAPDGRHLAIVSDGVLWVRSLDQVDAVRLDRTDGASYPFWSPDSQTIAFFADGELRRIPRTGGTPQRLAPALEARGGTWGPDGTIVFSADQGLRGLSRVPAGGGPVMAATTLDRPRLSSAHRYPQFLPDGRFLYLYLDGDAATAGVYVASLGGGAATRVLDGNDWAVYAPMPGRTTGHLLFARGDALMAQRFEPQTLTLSGSPVVVAEPVSAAQHSGHSRMSVSTTGTLAHSDFYNVPSALTWFDRAGRRHGVAATTVAYQFSLSADGRAAVAVDRPFGRGGDVWAQPRPDAALTRVTFSGARANPVWSPRGDRLAYTTYGTLGLAQFGIYWSGEANASAESQILATDTLPYLYGWMPDGSAVVARLDEGVVAVPLDASHPRVPLSEPSRQDIQFPQVSPDGRWLAYSTDVDGRGRVIVQAIPPTAARWQVGADGGAMPRWIRRGAAVIYRGPDGRLREAAVRASAPGMPPRLDVVSEVVLDVRVPAPDQRYHTYDVTPDGQRVLVDLPAEGPLLPTTIVLNWQAALAQ
jgi:Tol biopolymer transport system component